MDESFLNKAREEFKSGNYSIAFDSYKQYLALAPSDSKARKEYREKYRQQMQFEGKGEKLIKSSTSQLKLNIIFRNVKGNEETIKKCEEVLTENPYDLTILFKLGKAAKEAGLYETAIDTFSDMTKHFGNRDTILRELALTYWEMENYSKALETFKRYDTSNETSDIRKIIGDLPALITAGQYEKAKSFTDVEKEAGKSSELERARETPKTKEDILKKISELELIVENEKEDGKKRLSAVSEISGLHRRINQYDEAIEILERGKSFGGDYTLDKSIVELKIEKEDCKIAQLEERLQKEANDNLKEQLEQMTKEKWKISVEEYSALVSKIPTVDLELHLKLGEGCFYLGKITKDQSLIEKAIGELQKEYTEQSQKNKAGMLLGMAFAEIGLYNVAEQHFMELLNENVKRAAEERFDILYELGKIRELKGDIKGALGAFTQIYMRAIGFKDVAKLVLKLNKELEDKNSKP